jgi:adenosylcobyric acid synthase
VRDPLGIEGSTAEIDGLGLLDVETVMAPEKRLANSAARSIPFETALSGYEIHLGETDGPDHLRPYVEIEGRADGAMSVDGKIAGTYLHRLFDSDGFRARLLESFGIEGGQSDYRKSVDDALDGVAAQLEQHLDPRWLGALMAG